jgi:hypothetical protein
MEMRQVPPDGSVSRRRSPCNLGAPTAHQVLWVDECLKNKFARCVEDPRDEKRTVSWFGALIRVYLFWHLASPSNELWTDRAFITTDRECNRSRGDESEASSRLILSTELNIVSLRQHRMKSAMLLPRLFPCRCKTDPRVSAFAQNQWIFLKVGLRLRSPCKACCSLSENWLLAAQKKTACHHYICNRLNIPNDRPTLSLKPSRHFVAAPVGLQRIARRCFANNLTFRQDYSNQSIQSRSNCDFVA